MRIPSRAGRILSGLALASLVLAGLAIASKPSAAQTALQVNQTFNSQGPGPRVGPAYAVQSADNSPNGSEAGAVQTILPDFALGTNTYFAGTPNGGIWITANGGLTWKPLTDNQASLSIASLSLDPTDPTGKTIIAGVGAVDNGEYSQFNLGSFQGRGGPQTGLLYSTNGGATWSALGGTTLAGQTVAGVDVRGQTILAGTYEIQAPNSATAGYGLYRSTDGGATFSKLTGNGSSGLPNAAITSLAADPNDPTTFYAAVKTGADKGATAVYISHNTGATWTPVFTASNSGGIISSIGDPTVITLVAGPNGSVAIALSDLAGKGSLAAVFLSGNQGTTWNQLTAAPNVVAGGQTPVNLHLAIDPTNKNIVYLSGDAYQNCGGAAPTTFCSLELFRLNYNPGANSSTATSLTFEGTSANNFLDAKTVHADSRSITFDQAGNLILTSDGGIYKLSDPQGSGTWQGLNGNLIAFEGYSVAYDANSKRLGIAAQDNGVSLQSAPGSSTFNAINFGDGTNIAINDRTLTGQSAIYSAIANFDFFSRMIVNKQGQMVSPLPDPVNNPGGIPITCNGGQACSDVINSNQTFSALLALNKIDPTLMAISGATDVFTTQDTLAGANGVNANSIDLSLTNLGTSGGATAITYGTVNDTRAIAVGASTGQVWFSPNNAAGSLTQLSNYAGDTPTGIVFDTRIQSRIFVADATNLYYTRNAGGAATFTTLTSSLPGGFIRPTSVEFISNNGVNALLVGGMNTPLTCTSAPNGCVIGSTQSPITVADSDSSGLLSHWRAFGQGLPNTLVYQMAYNPTADVLAVSSIGRGAYLLYDVTSYFAQANVLQFGLADNDSMPDASYLTDGTVGARPLIKYGAGTLTIAGNATYTGGTTINAGTLVLGNGGASGSVIGNIVFCSNAADTTCDPTTNKFLAFNRSDVYNFGANITGPGQVVQAGSGTTILSGTNTYTGPTTVDAGMLSVNGSITSDVTVNPLAILAGSGSVNNVGINAGGVLMPGDGTPGSSLALSGNLAFQSGAIYLVQLSPATTSFASVSGTAALAGTVQANFTSGTYVIRQYDILHSGGLNGTTFAGVTSNLPGFDLSMNYNASDVFLNLHAGLGVSGNLPLNQQTIATRLNSFFNSGGSLPSSFVNLFGLTGSNLDSGLAQVAGEPATGSQQSTFTAMSQFIGLLTDPLAGRGNGIHGATAPTGYAEQDVSAYAATRRLDNERAAYAAFSKTPLAKTFEPRWSVWAEAFGGSQSTDGNAAIGSSNATSRIAGTAVGADYLLSPRTLAGFAFAGGGTSFGVSNLGSGRSDLFQAGAYVRHTNGAAYITGALAYGWQDIITDRTVTVAGADHLHAEFNANAFSGRLEGGYRYLTPMFGGLGVTPYAAAQFTTFDLPAYAETARSGSNAFALAYGARSVTDARSELGLRTDKSFALASGVLTLRGRIAWAHDFDPDRAVAATFQALPGSSFVVNGAALASDSALTTASAEIKWMNGWSAAATFEGEFSAVTASYAGKGLIRYQW
jgi:autotransporter-associated beta strand protein